jgi:hypothetical protein
MTYTTMMPSKLCLMHLWGYVIPRAGNLSKGREESPVSSKISPTQNFPASYGTRRFITVFTRVRYWSLFWARSILPNYLFPFDFSTSILYGFLFSPIRATCHAHLIFLDLIILITTGTSLLNKMSFLCRLSYLRSCAFLEEKPNLQLLKNIPAFYGTRRFITVFTKALHWSLFWAAAVGCQRLTA